MAQETTSARIEIEIHRYLSAGKPLADTVTKLIKKFSNYSLSITELETISTFLMYAGFYATLVEFLIDCLDRNLVIPWAHFCEALFLSTPAIPQNIKAAVLRGAESQSQLQELARSPMLDHFDERLPELRKKRMQHFKQITQKRREDMLGMMAMLQAQGLLDEEEKLLQKFSYVFPHDAEIKKHSLSIQKRRSMELIQEISTNREDWVPIPLYQLPDEETQKLLNAIENSMVECLNQNLASELAHDFAIAHMQWENFPAALKFVDLATVRGESNPESLIWLRLEILLQLRRFLDVLNEIQTLEHEWSQYPESIFGLLYYKALCFWELTQRQQAIDIMESITIVRPNFRSAKLILSEWRGDVS